jgi:hypothetical protein
MTCHVLRMLIEGLDCLRIDLLSLRVDSENHRSAFLTAASEHDAREIAKGFGVELREVTTTSSQWLAASVDLNDVTLLITSPTRARTPKLEAIP